MARTSEAATPYNQPVWVRSWWRSRQHAGLEWRCFAAWDASGRLVGVLPLVQYLDGVVRYAGHDLHDAAEALVSEQRLQQLWNSALKALRSGDSTLLDLPTLGDKDLGALRTLNLPAALHIGGVDPGARLHLPPSWETHCGGLTATRRRRMRAERRALERDHGVVRFEVVDDVASLPEAVDELWRLRELSWQQRGRYDQLAGHVRGASIRTFLADLASGDESGLVAVGRLVVGERLAASALLLYAARRVWYAMCCFDPELAKYGPGRLLLSESVRAAIDRRLTTIELGRGVEEYKFSVGAARYQLTDVVVDLRGSCLRAAGDPTRRDL